MNPKMQVLSSSSNPKVCTFHSHSLSTLAILPILLGVPGLLVHFCGFHRPSALCTLIGNVAIYIVRIHCVALQLAKCPCYSYWNCSIICCCGLWVPYLSKLDALAPVVPHFHDKIFSTTGKKRKQKDSVPWHGNREVFPGHMAPVQTCDDCINAKRRSLSSWRMIMYHSSHSSILWRMEFVKLRCRAFDAFCAFH